MEFVGNQGEILSLTIVFGVVLPNESHDFIVGLIPEPPARRPGILTKRQFDSWSDSQPKFYLQTQTIDKWNITIPLLRY